MVKKKELPISQISVERPRRKGDLLKFSEEDDREYRPAGKKVLYPPRSFKVSTDDDARCVVETSRRIIFIFIPRIYLFSIPFARVPSANSKQLN